VNVTGKTNTYTGSTTVLHSGP